MGLRTVSSPTVGQRSESVGLLLGAVLPMCIYFARVGAAAVLAFGDPLRVYCEYPCLACKPLDHLGKVKVTVSCSFAYVCLWRVAVLLMRGLQQFGPH